MSWTPGSSSGSETLTRQDKVYAQHINELRQASDSRLQIGGDLGGTATSPRTLSRTASLTIGSSNADYITDGVADNVQFSAAIAALKAAGGGKLFVRKGNYSFAARVYSDGSNIEIVGESYGSVVISIDFETSGIQGAFVFYSDTTTPIRNITFRNIWINHNGKETNGIAIGGNTSSAVLSENFLIEDCEFYGRDGDTGGSRGSIYIFGAKSGTLGSLRNIRINRCVFRDNTAAVGTQPYSINVISNDLDTFTVENCTFKDLYGTTIIMSSTTQATRRNFSFDHNTFINTKLKIGGLGNATAMDIRDVREGFKGISITNNLFDDTGNFEITDERFNLGIYASTGFIVSGNRFYGSRAIIAPGHSFPSGHESEGWTFSDNIIYEALQFADSDGHYAGTYDNNIFIRVGAGAVFGGYGRHYPSQFSNNIVYDCGENQIPPPEYRGGLVLIESGGMSVINNIFYTTNVQPKYIIFELAPGENFDDYNHYENNKIIGPGPTSKAFYLDLNYKHNIRGNVGLVESRITNSASNGSASVSDLVTSDIVAENYTQDGVLVSPYKMISGIATVTSSTTLTPEHNTVLADASGGAIALSLPTAASASGRQVTIKKIDSSGNSVTIDGNGAETIDGAATAAISTQWNSITIQSNGTAWFII